MIHCSAVHSVLGQLLPELWKEPLRQIMMLKAIQELSMVKSTAVEAALELAPQTIALRKKVMTHNWFFGGG